jgi:hypothetical protein
MPKTFLHDVFANHTDVTSCNDSGINGACIHKQGFNCQLTDLVVPSVYTVNELRSATIPLFSPVQNYIFKLTIPENNYSVSQGRGPPFDI